MSTIIEKQATYVTKVVGYGPKLRLVKTPDGVLHIDVREHPRCTWFLEGDSFYCSHDESEVVLYTEDHMDFTGHYQTDSRGYACAECGEPLDGSPEEDRLDAIAERHLMEVLEK